MAIEVMRLQVREDYEWETKGIVLVCNTSDRVLNLPINVFEDEDEAESFLAWCYGANGIPDPRRLSTKELEMAVDAWREWNTVAP